MAENKKLNKEIIESAVPEQLEAFQTLRKKMDSGELWDDIDISKPLDTCFPRKDKRYTELLEKYMYDKDLQELIMLCIIDDKRERERQYVYNNKYPEDRDTLMKLFHDLTARAIAVEYKRQILKKGVNNE